MRVQLLGCEGKKNHKTLTEEENEGKRIEDHSREQNIRVWFYFKINLFQRMVKSILLNQKKSVNPLLYENYAFIVYNLLKQNEMTKKTFKSL